MCVLSLRYKSELAHVPRLSLGLPFTRVLCNQKGHLIGRERSALAQGSEGERAPEDPMKMPPLDAQKSMACFLEALSSRGSLQPRRASLSSWCVPKRNECEESHRQGAVALCPGNKGHLLELDHSSHDNKR